MMKKILIFIIMVTFSNTAFCESAIGTISNLTIHASAHPNPSVQGHTTFNFTASLISPCTTLYLAPEDKTAVSFLLSYKVQKENIRVHYFPNVLSPWSAQTCRVYAIELP